MSVYSETINFNGMTMTSSLWRDTLYQFLLNTGDFTEGVNISTVDDDGLQIHDATFDVLCNVNSRLEIQHIGYLAKSTTSTTSSSILNFSLFGATVTDDIITCKPFVLAYKGVTNSSFFLDVTTNGKNCANMRLFEYIYLVKADTKAYQGIGTRSITAAANTTHPVPTTALACYSQAPPGTSRSYLLPSSASYETTANSVLMLSQYTHNLVSDQQVRITDTYSGSDDITYVNQKGILVGNSKYYNQNGYYFIHDTGSNNGVYWCFQPGYLIKVDE